MKLTISLYACSLLATIAAGAATRATQVSRATDAEDPVLLLSTDKAFHFELLVPMGQAATSGSDVGPILGIAKNLKPGDMMGYSRQFHELAKHTKAEAENPDNAYDPINVRDTWFSASTYFRRADFYLHGNWTDPLLKSLWKEATDAFDKGIAALPVPGERIRIPVPKAKGEPKFTVEAIWYGASNDKNAKYPTLIIGNGYDAPQETLYHTYVVPALALGYNCITYEGPGQPTVRRYQDVGFIPNWERVVTPVVDYVLSKKSQVVDENRVTLIGNSNGGYLAARAAAFEHRLAAVILIDGVWDIYDGYTSQLPPQIKTLFESGNKKKFDDTILGLRKSGKLTTQVSWGLDQGLWAYFTHSPYEFFKQF